MILAIDLSAIATKTYEAFTASEMITFLSSFNNPVTFYTNLIVMLFEEFSFVK